MSIYLVRLHDFSEGDTELFKNGRRIASWDVEEDGYKHLKTVGGSDTIILQRAYGRGGYEEISGSQLHSRILAGGIWHEPSKPGYHKPTKLWEKISFRAVVREIVSTITPPLVEGSAEHPDIVVMIDQEYGLGARFRIYEHGVDRAEVQGWDGVRRWLDMHSHEEAWVLFQRATRPFGRMVIQDGNFTGDRLRISSGAIHPDAQAFIQR